MTEHREQRLLPWSDEQLYSVVADVENYPAFLPWCTGARITDRDGNIFWAELDIGFRGLKKSYTSRVTLTPPREVVAIHVAGPFRNMENRWQFISQPDGGCIVDFFIEFEFRSPVHNAVAGLFFLEASRRMIHSFETRAMRLFGNPEHAIAHGAQVTGSD